MKALHYTPEAAKENTKLAANNTTLGAADFPAEKLPALPPKYERDFITTRELQKTVLPLSRRSLFEWRRKKILPSIQVGSKIYWHRESVIAALLRRQNGGADQ